MKKIMRFLPALMTGLLLVPAITVVTAPVYAQQGYQQATGQRINEIRVLGTERIEPETVLTYMDVRVGDNMTEETLDRALKSLFGTGLFADVVLRQKGNVLEVTLAENPVINQVAFEGNDKIEDEELLAEVQLRPRQVLTRNKVQSDVNRLYQVYQRNGRFSVNIEPKIIKLDQNRVDLVFEVTEGEVTVIKGIRFVGNQAYDDDKLRSEISTKEDRWYRFLATDDRYDPDRIKYDEEMLRRFYLSQGYADFRVVSSAAELSKDRDEFYVTFMIEEGQRYRVGDVKISSMLHNFDANVLVPEVAFKEGEWYDAGLVEDTVDNITKALESHQFLFVNVRPDTVRNRENTTVSITFNITETTPVYVERIDVGGNVRTLDKVIRREFSLVEGDPFNKTKLAKSEQAIKDLGFFEAVEVSQSQGSAPDKTVVNVNVQEKSTGELSVGAGFSTADGPLADFRIRERNFLGKGQDVTLAATVAGERTEFDFSFTEPYFLDRDLSAGIDLFHITRDLQDESSYDQRRTGGALRVGYPLSEHWRQSLRYGYEMNDINNVDTDASRFIRDQEGERVTSAISQRLTYDTRDSILFPTNGMNAWLDTEWAGLGGDASYLSAQIGASYFYPLADRWILNVLGETGVIGGLSEDVEINERFFLGGSSLRGFERAGVGPRDPATDDSLGGNYFYRGSVEMSFPVGLPEEMGVLGHGFTDFGSLWHLDETDPTILDESSLRATAGLGVSWRSPMGPVRADVAVPYVKEDFDREEVFRFSFGTRF
ncbi:MAG: outer membrane protein assembly factor BamA [Micavibrio aeruginosavorus]|uniref:Outer membrane protein assembly factor BamA n=1 Tax=Micavibrio aeruginosavorus TaxID=349221 RepID=A0A7T5R0L4_9BACT|nr:MAG: outer membrane protein assembly factor BamA [Micavibrio aeruginosavorus]